MNRVRLRTSSELLYPVPVVLVTCQGLSGPPNIITIAWTGIICSDPGLVHISVRPQRHSYRLIRERGEFAINIPTAALAKKVDYCGVVSGRDVDKFKECGFTPIPGETIDVPLIAECPVGMECRVVHSLEVGVHTLFIGEVTAVRADESVVKGNSLDFQKVDPLVFFPPSSSYGTMKGLIGSYGFSKKRPE
jgi:flavin reductase (DIM6/NTAB) family NADH-FMN oxidoreductase RutF